MDNLFNELYNNIIKEENIKEEVCNICHYKTTEDKITLSCNHIYHHKCLGKLDFCPYCNKKIIINELKDNNTCTVLLKSGVNKGKECGRFMCKIHKIKPKNINKSICTSILKSGVNKGKECGRVNCGLHKKNIIVV